MPPTKLLRKSSFRERIASVAGRDALVMFTSRFDRVGRFAEDGGPQVTAALVEQGRGLSRPSAAAAIGSTRVYSAGKRRGAQSGRLGNHRKMSTSRMRRAPDNIGVVTMRSPIPNEGPLDFRPARNLSYISFCYLVPAAGIEPATY
jgi:hypothetical protein